MFEPSDRRQVLVKPFRQGVRGHGGHDGGEQELEDPPDVVVRVVGALKDERVDPTTLPCVGVDPGGLAASTKTLRADWQTVIFVAVDCRVAGLLGVTDVSAVGRMPLPGCAW